MTETLPEMLEIAQAASKGVWRECEHVDDGCQCGLVWATNENVPICQAPMRYPEVCPNPAQQRANSRFIATFDPPTVKKLIRQVEHHRETLRQIRTYNAEKIPPNEKEFGACDVTPVLRERELWVIDEDAKMRTINE